MPYLNELRANIQLTMLTTPNKIVGYCNYLNTNYLTTIFRIILSKQYSFV